MRKPFEALWAIRPEAVPTVVRLLALDTGKIVAGPEAAAWAAAQPSMRGRGAGKVAVIPVQGVLTNDGPAYYGSNYTTIANAAEKAAADPDVQRIILSVDSPGGEVTGLPETAALLASIAKQSPSRPSSRVRRPPPPTGLRAKRRTSPSPRPVKSGPWASA